MPESQQPANAVSGAAVAGDERVVARLRGELDRQLAAIDLPSRYATVNIPTGSGNIGSHLLWLAESLYCRDCRGAELVYASSAEEFSAQGMAEALDGGAIVLRGGYLGDQWDATGGRRRRLFESIVRDFPDHPILLMPQSVEYFDPIKARAASEAFAKHPRLTLLVRDGRSLENARRLFPNTKLVLSPDIVFHLAELVGESRVEPAGRSILYLCRADWQGATELAPERLQILGLVSHEWRVEPEVGEPEDYAAWFRRNPGLSTLSDQPYGDSLKHAAWFLYLAISQLRRHRLVITNRLHGHILCSMLGMPHILVPGPYDKMSSFHRTWTQGMQGCRYAERGEDVRAAAAELLALRGDAL